MDGVEQVLGKTHTYTQGRYAPSSLNSILPALCEHLVCCSTTVISASIGDLQGQSAQIFIIPSSRDGFIIVQLYTFHSLPVPYFDSNYQLGAEGVMYATVQSSRH